MPYNNIISRGDAAALIPQEVSQEIVKGVSVGNPLMSLARRLPNMSRAQKRVPVANLLAIAYFVNGDTGLKQTTELNWANRFIDAEEIAAIVPIPEAVLDDADFDIWGEVKPALVEAFGVAIPHSDTIHVHKPVIAVCILPQPVIFQVMGSGGEEVPVSFIFMLAIDDPNKHIEMLNKLSILFQNKDIMLDLLETKTGELYQKLNYYINR